MCCIIIPVILGLIVIIASIIIHFKGESKTAEKWKENAITTFNMLAIIQYLRQLSGGAFISSAMNRTD